MRTRHECELGIDAHALGIAVCTLGRQLLPCNFAFIPSRRELVGGGGGGPGVCSDGKGGKNIQSGKVLCFFFGQWVFWPTAYVPRHAKVLIFRSPQHIPR